MQESKSSYPELKGGVSPWTSERHLLVAIKDPPSVTDLKLPELPCPPRKSLIDEWYSLSTHIVPAAYPRSTPDVGYPAGSDTALPGETKGERKERMVKARDEYIRLKTAHWDGSIVGNSEKRLWVCLNRYKRRGMDTSGEKKLTLFLLHANGFGKEIWEPMLKHLVSTSLHFDEIWAWEAVNHGDSALINAGSLCALYDWADNTRDILHFLVDYLPDSMGELPVHLPRLPRHVSESRRQHGYSGRTLVSVGHSFGGNSIARAAITCPALFSSLILADPVVLPPPCNVPWVIWMTYDMSKLVDGALQRRDEWPSREEAKVLLMQNPFFAAWDPAVLNVYVETGLYLDENGRFKLKMSRESEATIFADARAALEVWDLLPELDERIELKFVMPGQAAPQFGSSNRKDELVWLRPMNVSNVIIMSAGHLIPHEAPGQFAQEIHGFVQRKYGTVKANL